MLSRSTVNHPYAVNGRSPRAIVEGIIDALDSIDDAAPWDRNPDTNRLLARADAVLRELHLQRIGFCREEDRER
jgi:hypothetical protein